MKNFWIRIICGTTIVIVSTTLSYVQTRNSWIIFFAIACVFIEIPIVYFSEKNKKNR